MMPVMAIWLCVISVMDIRSRRVPVWMLAVGGMLAALVLFGQCTGEGRGISDVLKALLPGVLLLAVAFATKKAGYGDGITMLAAGGILEGERSLLLLGTSLFLIAVWAAVLLVFGKARRNTGLPYLPFLAGAWFAVSVL